MRYIVCWRLNSFLHTEEWPSLPDALARVNRLIDQGLIATLHIKEI